MNVQCASLGSTSLMTSRQSVCPAPRTPPPRGREQPPRMSVPTDARLLKENRSFVTEFLKLSLDNKQCHLFAQWPLATPGHTFTFLHSSTPKQQGSNTWCQAHPPPLYLCRGGGRVHHHHSTFPPPPLHLHSTATPPSSLSSPSSSDIHYHQLQSKRRLQQIRDIVCLCCIVKVVHG